MGVGHKGHTEDALALAGRAGASRQGQYETASNFETRDSYTLDSSCRDLVRGASRRYGGSEG